MQTIHGTVKSLQAGGQYIDYIKKLKTSRDAIEAELQQGVFNDVNEIGTSKKRRKKKR